MTILFGNLGDGDTVRAFGTVAAAASLAAIVVGAEAERYAQVHRPALPLTSIPAPTVSGVVATPPQRGRLRDDGIG